MSTLYENISRLCDEKGIKPSRMCVEAGVSKSIMSRLKHDSSSFLSLEVAQKIADYFGVTVSEVVSGTTQGNLMKSYEGYKAGRKDEQERQSAEKTAAPKDDGLTDDEKTLLTLFRTLPAEHQAAIVRRLQELARLQKAQDDLLKF